MSSPSPRRSSRSRASSVAPSANGAEPSSDLAQPLPASSPAAIPATPATPQSDATAMPAPRSVGGPGSVRVSEVDLSSPLLYGTPGSVRTPRSSVGVSGTPIRIRSDIQSEKRLRQVNVTPAKAPGAGGSEIDAPSSEIGTPGRRSGRSRGGTPSRRAQTPSLPPSDAVPPSEHSDSAPHLVIWGTDVSVTHCKAKFRRFIQNFIETDVEDDERMKDFDEDKPYYMQRLAEV